MNNFQEIIDKLKADKIRITPVRQALVKIFTLNDSPLPFDKLKGLLRRMGLTPNKTTLYRELEFLKLQSLIKEVAFGDRMARYELAGSHHHHLVCVSCDKIEDITLKDELKDEIKQIQKQSSFEIIDHALEFFGRCGVCKLKPI